MVATRSGIVGFSDRHTLIFVPVFYSELLSITTIQNTLDGRSGDKEEETLPLPIRMSNSTFITGIDRNNTESFFIISQEYRKMSLFCLR